VAPAASAIVGFLVCAGVCMIGATATAVYDIGIANFVFIDITCGSGSGSRSGAVADPSDADVDIATGDTAAREASRIASIIRKGSATAATLLPFQNYLTLDSTIAAPCTRWQSAGRRRLFI
jgi:hypothetical protein